LLLLLARGIRSSREEANKAHREEGHCSAINGWEAHLLLHLLYLRQQPSGLQPPLSLPLLVGIKDILILPGYCCYYNLCQKSDETSSRAYAKALVLGSIVVNDL